MRNRKERRERIIETIVSAFIRTAKPVGSAYLAESCDLGMSPATIRGIMKELEDEGFLKKPHTSAGRLPTIKCYRYFVSRIMPELNPSEIDIGEAKRLIEDALRDRDADIFMDHVARVLSEATDLIGVAMSPSFDQGIFDRLDIVGLGGSTFLVVISLANGIVRTINLTVGRVIPKVKVEETARLLTGRLHGLTVADIKRTIGGRLNGVRGGDRSLFDIILDRRDDIFDFTGDRLVHVAGLSRLLVQPEFALSGSSLGLVELYERKGDIIRMLGSMEYPENGVSIAIGVSDFLDTTPPLSLVSAFYRLESAAGAVAVIGPTRIDYPRMTAIVRYTAGIASSFFSAS
jgi:heat-inducible transcriptional repressor